jgi:ABC-2 type transport system ATP-binding protein
MPNPVIETIELTKTYDQIEAVNGLSLSVPPDSIYGFLGRNGSGKTTTIKMLLGMTHPTSGEARVFGKRADHPEEGVEIRRRVGFVSEEKQLYSGMTVGQILNFTRPFFPAWKADLEKKLLRLFELPLNQKVGKLSKGNRARLALLLALPRGADLFILDEPSSGLDPAMTEAVLQMLVSLVASDGATVFFSTHHIAEVEQIADHVCIIDRGRTVVDGALDELKAAYRRINLVFDKEPPPPLLAVDGIAQVKRQGRSVSLLASRNVNQIIDQARSLNAVSVDVIPVTLKEIFLETVYDESKDISQVE